MSNLNTYNAVKTSLFVRIQVDEYRTNPNDAYTNEVLLFSDHDSSFVINSETYEPLGKLTNVSASVSELRSSNDTVTISLSGVPSDALPEVLHSKIKGAPVNIYRGWFDALTGNIIGSVEGRFIGSVNNFSLQEEFDVVNRTASNIIILDCASSVTTLQNKTAGRKTNPQSNKAFYPNDTGFDNVPSLVGAKLNFGA